jgi:hypothetical protein
MKLNSNNIRFLILALLLANTILSLASGIRLSGFVKDSATNEVLIGANIVETKTFNGTSTDNKGYFSLNVSSPTNISFTFTGYKSKSIVINNVADTFLIIILSPGTHLSEISVNAKRSFNANITRLSSSDFEKTPVLGAKPDIIKTLQLLPGVQAQSEGLSLFNVRGGEPGQNQYLLDDVPLIYVNHFGGLTSVFNPDMINSVDFYKGSFPARHGGKLSSIVDITQREGNVNKYQGSYSIGLTDASFSFEGPLLTDKMSFIVTARKTLTDGLIATVSTIDDINKSIVAYGFHDINAKLSLKHDDKNTFNLNFYQGDDYFNFWGKPWELEKNESNHISQIWGNWLISVNWKSIIGDKLFVENIVSYTKYRNKSRWTYKNIFDQMEEISKINNSSSVNNLYLKTIWKIAILKNLFLEFGNETNKINYEPGHFYNSNAQFQQINTTYNTFKTAFFIDNKIDIGKAFQIRPSIRYNLFVNDDNIYSDFEPRVILGFKPNHNQTFEFNYMRGIQYDHLIHIQDQIIKSEVWLPANLKNLPQISDQLSMSWLKKLYENQYMVELNLYYKKTENLTRLKMGYENALGLTNIENKLLNKGEGMAYGSEISFSKTKGELKGSFSYSYSLSKRSFAEINGGRFFDYEYNSPHSLNISLNKQLSKKWNFSLVWTYLSGLPFTPANGKYLLMNLYDGNMNNELAIDFEDYNSSRMQSYHRLDIGFNYETKTKKGNKAIWTFAVYNLYNRKNPYNYYYDDDKYLGTGIEYTNPLKLYKVTWFPIIPSFSYKVLFNDIKLRK